MCPSPHHTTLRPQTHILRPKDSSSPAPQFLKGVLSRSSLRPDDDPLAQFEDWFKAAKRAGEKAPETTTFTTVRMPEGRPSSRIVYLKEVLRASSGVAGSTADSQTATTTEADITPSTANIDVVASGFVIYSNWGTSQKAADLKTNPLVGLTFWWPSMERQVRVQGRAVKLTLGQAEFSSSSSSSSFPHPLSSCNTPTDSSPTNSAQEYYSTRPRGSRIGAWASRQSAPIDDDRNTLDGWVQETEDRFRNRDADIPCPPYWGGILIVPEEMEFWQGRDSRLHDRFVYRRVNGGLGDVLGKLPTLTFPEDDGEKKNEVGSGKGADGVVVIPDGEWSVQRLSP